MEGLLSVLLLLSQPSANQGFVFEIDPGYLHSEQGVGVGNLSRLFKLLSSFFVTLVSSMHSKFMGKNFWVEHTCSVAGAPQDSNLFPQF